MVVLQLLKEEDLASLTDERLAFYEQIVYRELISNKDLASHLQGKLSDAGGRLARTQRTTKS